jgi:phytanoyl-CoA hydroxylase
MPSSETLTSVDLYAADLYAHNGNAEVLAGPHAYNDKDATAFFKENGYLAIADVYNDQEVEDAKQALDELIIRRYKELTGLQIETADDGSLNAPKDKPEAPDPATMMASVRKLNDITTADPRIERMLHHPLTMKVVEQLVGEKVEKFQEMSLLKPPGGREKPWHQDHAYFNADNAKHIIGVWIALDEATAANGCMHILPGKHHEPYVHFARRDWQICDETILKINQQCKAVPLKPGGVLFFDSFLPHGTPTNHTKLRRRAVQLHFKPASAASIETEERMATWGAEGKNVEC